MSQETDFKLALGKAIQDIIDIPVVDGVIDGPQRRDIGCVYLAAGHEDSANVVRARYEGRVRVFLNEEKKQPAEDKPISMSPLEAIVNKVQIELSAQNQSIGGTWFARLSEWEYSPEKYGVEMAFMSVGWNPWAHVAPE